MSVKEDLIEALISGEYEGSAREMVSAHRDEVLREAAEKIRAHDATAISADAPEIFGRTADLIDPDKEGSADGA